MIFLLFFMSLFLHTLISGHPSSSFDEKIERLRQEKPHLFHSAQKPHKKTSSLFTYENACHAIDIGALLIGLYKIRSAYQLVYASSYPPGRLLSPLHTVGNHALFAETAAIIALKTMVYKTILKMGLYGGALVLKPLQKIAAFLFTTKTT